MSEFKKILILVIVFSAFVLSLPVTEIVIGAKYIDSEECANDRIVRPAIWLLTMGSVTATIVVTTATLLLISIRKQTENYCSVIIHITGYIFTVVWSVIGAIALWRDNTSCSPKELKDMMWVSIIMHLVSVVGSICLSK